MNKVVYVSSHFLPIGKDVTKKVATGEKKKGMFGSEKDVYEKKTEWQKTGLSDCEIDNHRLAQDVFNEIQGLNEEGYKVVSTQAVLSGNYNSDSGVTPNGGWGYGYGYSYTSSIMIIAEKINTA